MASAVPGAVQVPRIQKGLEQFLSSRSPRYDEGGKSVLQTKMRAYTAAKEGAIYFAWREMKPS